MERRLVEALDQQGGGGGGTNDASLLLEQIQKLSLEQNVDDGRKSLINLLQDLEYLVLDEADRLLARAFESELESVLDLLPKDRGIPTWMFSATFPKQIEPRLNQVWTRAGAQSPIQNFLCQFGSDCNQ